MARGSWLDGDDRDAVLPPLKDPFAPAQADDDASEPESRGGVFQLPPLPAGADLVDPTASQDEPGPPPSEAPALRLEPEPEAPATPFSLPGPTGGGDRGLARPWLERSDDGAGLPPLSATAPPPLRFALDAGAEAETDLGGGDPILDAGFLSRREQALVGGGFRPRPASPARPPEPAPPPAPDAPEAPAARRSGISDRPTAIIPRDPAASGISEAPTSRHQRAEPPTPDDPGTAATIHRDETGTAATLHAGLDSWDGTEGTMVTPPRGAGDSWDGTEGTMVTPPRGAGDSWDGTEGTMVTPPRGADEGWDGTEGTMVTPPAGEDWDADATSVGPARRPRSSQSSGRIPWVGTEATAPFTPGTARPGDATDDTWLGADETLPPAARGGPAPAGPRDAGEDTATRATLVPGRHTPPTLFTTSKRTSAATPDRGGDGGESGGTSTSFDAQWHLAGRPGPATGQVWGDYEIGGIIGQGGMGLVYRALQKSLGRRCAVKVLSAHLANNKQLLDRFELEARAAGTMRSHNVVAVYAAGNVDGQPYYVMEYVDGTDLDHIVKDRRAKEERFTVDEAIDYTLQAARGLVEAASHGIVHRDIKPPNLMVTAKGEIKITDFGIVKVQGEAGLTLTGQAMGTPAYLSPEQGRGEEVDARSDLYSLGVVFYELLTGGRPFSGNSADALIYQHSYAEPKLPREIDDSIPEDIQAVCIKLLAKKPENRYQSARDLVRDLEDFTEGKRLEALLQHKLSTGGAEALRENQSWLQRHGLKIGLAAAAMTLVAIGLTVWYNAAQRAEAERVADLTKRAGFLLESLTVLERQERIPDEAQVQLDELQRLHDVPELGEFWSNYESGLLDHWQTKLDRVIALREQLAPIGEDTQWTWRVLTTARAGLDALIDEVGTSGPEIRRWSALIGEQEAQVRGLRAALEAETARSFTEVPAKERRERIEPMIARLAVLAPEDDPQVAAFRARLDGWREQEAELVADLDAAKARDPKADTARYLEKLEIQLAQAADLYGTEDAAYLAWRDAIIDHVRAWRDDLQRAREAFAAPDLVTTVTWKRLQELHGLFDRLVDLEAFVDSPATRERWAADLAAADERWSEIRILEARVRPRLARVLGGPNPIDQQTVADLQELVAILGSEIDAEIITWQAKVRTVQELERTLSTAIDGRFFITELDQTFRDLKRLQRLVGPDDRRLRAWAQRLDVFYGPERPPWAAAFGRDRFGIYAMIELPGDQVQRLRYIPPGPVELGSPIDEPGRDATAEDEAQIQLRIPRAFWLAEAETTQAAWLGAMGSNPSRLTSRATSLDRPVNRVSLHDVRAFLERVAERRATADRPPPPLRLPGEHEWEYACRAGAPGRFSYLRLAEDTGELPLGEFAWYAANSNGSERPVAGKRPNPLGLYDMHGNVWEWCRNPYGSYQILVADGFQARESELQSARGGGWGDPPASLRAANRLGVRPDLRSAYLGFRVAADVTWVREPDGTRIVESERPPTERIDRDLLEEREEEAAADAEVEALMERVEQDGAAQTDETDVDGENHGDENTVSTPDLDVDTAEGEPVPPPVLESAPPGPASDRAGPTEAPPTDPAPTEAAPVTDPADPDPVIP